jgi:hypothetical protein
MRKIFVEQPDPAVAVAERDQIHEGPRGEGSRPQRAAPVCSISRSINS